MPLQIRQNGIQHGIDSLGVMQNSYLMTVKENTLRLVLLGRIGAYVSVFEQMF